MGNSQTILGLGFVAFAIVGVLYFLGDVNFEGEAVPWILGVGIVPFIIGMTLLKMGRKK